MLIMINIVQKKLIMVTRADVILDAPCPLSDYELEQYSTLCNICPPQKYMTPYVL